MPCTLQLTLLMAAMELHPAIMLYFTGQRVAPLDSFKQNNSTLSSFVSVSKKKPVQLRGNQAVRLSTAQPGAHAHSIAAELSVVHNAMRRQRYNRPLRVLGIRRQYTISIMKIIVILHQTPFLKKNSFVLIN